MPLEDYLTMIKCKAHILLLLVYGLLCLAVFLAFLSYGFGEVILVIYMADEENTL